MTAKIPSAMTKNRLAAPATRKKRSNVLRKKEAGNGSPGRAAELENGKWPVPSGSAVRVISAAGWEVGFIKLFIG